MIHPSNIKYNIKIFDLEYVFDEESDRKTICGIYWECSGSYSKNGDTWNSSRNGKTHISTFPPEGKKFIPYENITEQSCLSILKENQDFSTVEEAIALSISQQIFGTITNGVPWEK